MAKHRPETGHVPKGQSGGKAGGSGGKAVVSDKSGSFGVADRPGRPHGDYDYERDS